MTKENHDDGAAQPTTEPPPAYTGPERRSAMRLWQEKVDGRLKDGDERMQSIDERMQSIRDDLDNNTQSTARVEANTALVVDLLNNAQGAFRVLEMLAKLVKPLGVIAMAVGGFVGLWQAVKGGGPRP